MFGESISILEGLEITFLSMIIVFLALWIISKILDLFRVIFYERELRAHNLSNIQSAITSESNDEEVIIKSIDDESTLMVAITAAVMASNENKKSKIHIRSIKRVS